MKKIRFFSIISCILIMSPVIANAKMRIAIIDLKPDGVSQRTARTTTNMIRTELINMGRFTVVERSRMDAILKEQGFQKTGCTDASCAVEVGKLISARKMLVGDISKMGKAIIISVRIVDVEKGVSEYAATQKAISLDVVDEAVRKITKKLAYRISKSGKIKEIKEVEDEKDEPVVVSKTGYYLRGIVPGWGQIYSGHTLKGSLVLGGFVVSGGLMGWTMYNYFDKKKKYDDAWNLSENEFDSLYDDYKTAEIINLTMLSLTVAIYIYNWIDLIFFNNVEYGKTIANEAQKKDRFFYSLNIYDVQNEDSIEMRIDLNFGMRF
ncbi:CsgG/HfaB family protein [Spirochaetota bacterium]